MIWPLKFVSIQRFARMLRALLSVIIRTAMLLAAGGALVKLTPQLTALVGRLRGRTSDGTVSATGAPGP